MSRDLWRESLEQVLKKQGEPVIETRLGDSQTPEILSAANLWIRALERKRLLTRQGLKAGDVLCESGDSSDLPVNLVACAIGNFIYWPLRDVKALQSAESNESNQSKLFLWSCETNKVELTCHPAFQAEVVNEDTVLLLTTSGTQGSQKLVALSSSALLHQVKSFNQAIGSIKGSSRLIVLPLFHCFGLIMDFLSGLFSQQTIYLRNHVKFDTEDLLLLIRNEEIQYLSLVPRMLELLTLKASSDPTLAKSLQKVQVHVGGAPLTTELKNRSQELFAEVIEGYGLTESAGGVLLRGVPNQCDVKLKATAVNHIYELWMKSPALGSFQNKEKNLDEEGYYNTQDLVKEVESGQIQVLGRAQDLIKATDGTWTDLSSIHKQIETRFGIKVRDFEHLNGRLILVAESVGSKNKEIQAYFQKYFAKEVEVYNWNQNWNLEDMLSSSRKKSSSEAILEWIRRFECKSS